MCAINLIYWLLHESHYFSCVWWSMRAQIMVRVHEPNCTYSSVLRTSLLSKYNIASELYSITNLQWASTFEFTQYPCIVKRFYTNNLLGVCLEATLQHKKCHSWKIFRWSYIVDVLWKTAAAWWGPLDLNK